jgi:hypothetical protein
MHMRPAHTLAANLQVILSVFVVLRCGMEARSLVAPCGAKDTPYITSGHVLLLLQSA